MILKTENLRKTYQMGEVTVEALKQVNLSVEEGEFVSVMGPSGSGKSTLAHMVGLLDSPTGGKVLLEGTDVSGLSETEKARKRLETIGFVFQFYSLLKGFDSVQQAVLPQLLKNVPEREAERRARNALREVGLGDRASHKPSQLSGGQRQRAAIARALAGNPEILIADESTSQLDTETSQEIMNLYRRLANNGQTVITVNHEKELGRTADRVIWLEDGEIKDRDYDPRQA